MIAAAKAVHTFDWQCINITMQMITFFFEGAVTLSLSILCGDQRIWSTFHSWNSWKRPQRTVWIQTGFLSIQICAGDQLLAKFPSDDTTAKWLKWKSWISSVNQVLGRKPSVYFQTSRCRHSANPSVNNCCRENPISVWSCLQWWCCPTIILTSFMTFVSFWRKMRHYFLTII